MSRADFRRGRTSTRQPGAGRQPAESDPDDADMGGGVEFPYSSRGTGFFALSSTRRKLAAGVRRLRVY
jgi:hypothetical protein